MYKANINRHKGRNWQQYNKSRVFFNTPPTSMNIQTEYQEENNSPSGTLSDRLNLINIYMILQPKTAEYTFFSSAHECSPA